MATTHTAAKAPPGAIYDVAAQFALDLEATQTHAADQMLAAWSDTYSAVRAEYEQVLAKVTAAKAAGKPITPAWLYQQARLKEALASTKTEVHKYAAVASQIAASAHQSAVLAAAKHASKLGQVAMSGTGLHGDFTGLNPENLQHLAGFLADGSPLSDLFAGLADETAAAARHALITGIGLGRNPRQMAAMLAGALDLPRHRAETIMRTETQRVYRSVARQTFMANDDVLEGWVWTAHLDSRVCPACVAMDGTLHPLTAHLDGHPRCRCAMVPRTKDWAALGVNNAADTRPPVRSGIEWLKAQPGSVQRAILGPAKFKRYSQGHLDLSDLVARTSHEAWGTMRRERSLREIDLGVNANYADTPTAVAPAPRTANPRAAAKIANTTTLDEVQAALEGDGLTAQQVVDYRAAKVIHLNRLDYTVDLPGPDLTKAQAIADKLDQAAISKGWPSKGYSQTQAIYKAQANGTVGTQVGVVKSLTWEQKITAQKALALHNESLPKIIREGEKSNALKAEAAQAVKQHDEWLDYSANAPAGMQHDTLQGLLDEWMTKTKAEAWDVVHNAPADSKPLASHAYRKIAARRKAMKAERQAYDDAREAMLERRQTAAVWERETDTITIHEDGWGRIDYGDLSEGQPLDPARLQSMLDYPEWQPAKPTPQPAQVKALVDNLLKGSDGYLDAANVKHWEQQLAGPLNLAPQQIANLQEAIAQAKATLPWKPEPFFANMVATELKVGKITTEQVEVTIADPATTPQALANFKAGLAKHQQYLDDLAKVEKATAAPDPWTMSEAELAKATDAAMPGLQAGKFKPGDLVQKGNGKAVWEVQHVNGDGKIIVSKPGSAKKGNGAWQHPDQFKPITKAPDLTPTAPLKPVTFGAPPDPADLTYTGQTLGTHGARVYEHSDGSRWLHKPPKDRGDGFLATLDEVASRVTARFGVRTPDTFVVSLDGRVGSLQRMFDAKPAFPGGFKPSDLNDADLLSVQQHHVMDWLLSNHDGHLEQFLRMPDGSLVGIDKGQAFRWMGQDRLDWEFHPNGYYGAPEPVYNRLYREFAGGGKTEVLDPRHGPLADFIKSVEGMSDDELRAMLRPYAEQAAARGKLALPQPGFPGVKAASIPANDVEAFLDAVVARKNNLGKDFSALYDKAAAQRAKALPDWKPAKPKAAAGTTGKAKWVDAPEPVKPVAPAPPEQVHAAYFDDWLAKAEQRYAANPNKAKASLSETQNWARFQRVIEKGDRQAVQELHDRHYLDDALRDEALALIDQAAEATAAAERAHKAADAAYQAALKGYQRDLQDWREANGIVLKFRGMDEGVLRHDSDTAGTHWADSRFKADRWTPAQRKALKQYTGSDYSTWNSHLRRTAGDPGPYKATLDKIDAAMHVQPIPEDVILHRGTGTETFSIGGSRLGPGEAHRLADLVGTVQMDDAYISTSVGNQAAFSHQPVQIKFRAPAGTPGAYVKAFSNFSNERELILARGTHYYVHAAYQSGGRWIVEAEIVPADFVPPLNASGAPEVSPSVRKWTQ